MGETVPLPVGSEAESQKISEIDVCAKKLKLVAASNWDWEW